MPGKHITDLQVIKYKELRGKHSQEAAAAKTGISVASARRLEMGFVIQLASHTHSVNQHSAPSRLSVPLVFVELVAALPNSAVAALEKHQFAVSHRVNTGCCC